MTWFNKSATRVPRLQHLHLRWFVVGLFAAMLAGCSCGGESTIKDFECENGKDCRQNQTCQDGKCITTDKDKDGWSPNRGKGIEDCDDDDSAVYPGRNEVCDNKKDDNCNGKVDETPCRCDDGTERDCGSDKGACQKGRQQCISGKWGECKGGIEPLRETCNGVDDDCDGQVDEDFPILGKQCEVGQGECKSKGTYRCAKDRKAAECDAKEGQPTKEECDGKDNDCDGVVDEIKECQSYHTRQFTLSAATYRAKSGGYTMIGVLGQRAPLAIKHQQTNQSKQTLISGYLLMTPAP